MRTLLATLLLLTPALIGCIGTVDEQTLEEQLTPPRPLDTVVQQGHDHGDAGLHDFSWNIETIGYTTGYAEANGSGGFTELAVRLPYVYLCRGGPSPGVVVVDVNDPAEPEAVSHFQMPRCDDIEVSLDGDWVFASVQRNSPEELADETDGPANLPRGTWVLDASDKVNLAFESFYPMPYNGPHTIQYHQYEDGTEIVIHNLYDLYSSTEPTGQLPIPAPPGANPVSQRVEVAAFAEQGEDTYGLELVGTYQATVEAVQGASDQETIIPHDATVATNPLDGRTYMLVAYWDLGVHIVSLDDPAEPELVGTFDDFSPSAFDSIHQVRAFPTLQDGRWVLVAEPELITAEESGQITLIDASEPATPEKLGHWTLPGNVTIPEPFLFSPHNFDLDEEGRIYLAHQHAGIWVISTNPELGAGSLEAPAAIGAHLPIAPNGEAEGGPGTWGVFLEDGLLYASDGPTGLHILDYTGP